MESWWTALRSRMAARLFWTMIAVVALPLAAHFVLASREIANESARHRQHELELLSSSQARSLVARLSAAATIVRTLTAEDIGAYDAQLREQAASARIFRSVTVFDARDRAGPAPVLGLPINVPEARATESNQPTLMTAPLDATHRSVYLLRPVRRAQGSGFALFEISPEWLWDATAEGHDGYRSAIIDAEGRIVHGDRAVAEDVGQLFARRASELSERLPATADLAWQEAGEEWHGSLARIPLAAIDVAAIPWAVAVFAEQPSFFALTAGGREHALVIFALASCAALGAALWLAAAYAPALRRLNTALRDAREGYPAPIAVGGADEPRAVLDAWNRAAAFLRDRFHALHTLSEIDRLLLSSSELEQTLDAILSRLRAVTACQSVGITLIDKDAPTHGRVYVAWDSVSELPVSRVTLDPDMLAVLAEATEGVTVARCEEPRHSFLVPLKERGAELFWIWPVRTGERLAAILAVAYRDEPRLDPQVARYGAEFASRLAIALSNNARDEQLYRQAHFDALTQLPNRLLFRDRLAQELASASTGFCRGALLYIDLDHFKKVNDSVGHGAGDQLLTIVAQRLRACTKEGDTVARLGGDEFTVILRSVGDPTAARTIADRIIESLQLPVNIGGRDHFIRASIGITLFPDDAASIDELMRNADVAMYRAKESGRARAVFFDRSMTRKASGVATDSGLFRALRRRELSLFYQPQFDVAGGRLVALEALLRWQTPRDGLRYPREIVPAAEENGLIADIGAWVLETACAQLAAWRDQGIEPPRVAINVSSRQLEHEDFARSVRRTLEKHGLAPQLLELELTEAVFAEAGAGPSLAQLAALGVRLALDDFGTGYSSLSYLRQYPVQVLKIDRSFVEEVPHNPASATLAETIIVMAHALDKRVVAEGVETAEQLEFLRERRCDFAQGFFLAKPQSTAAVTEFLEARRASATEAQDLREAG